MLYLQKLPATLLVFILLNGLPMGSLSAAEADPHQFNVGYRVLDFKYPNRKQTLTLAIWYPTAAQTKPHTYGGPTSGKVAVDAAPLASVAGYPLLVFSHGYGGSGLGSVFFTEALAARGWIVACPDHHDRHAAVRIRTGQQKDFDRRGLLQYAKKIAASGPDDRLKYLYRLDEMRLALDSMLTSDSFGKLIDKNRIAVGGHSFGGFTALGISGAIKKYHDSRIKAVLLFSTGAGGYLFTEDELSAIQVPSLLFMGEREEKQLRGTTTMSALSSKIFRNLSPPKYFLEVKGSSHFSFNNRFSNRLGALLMSGSEEEFAVIRKYSIAFLEHYVAGRADPDHVLKQTDQLLKRYDVNVEKGTSDEY